MKLFYRQYGQGKPLIILHGIFGMSDNWMTLAKHLGENGFAVYAVDLRNHGQSPHSDEFTYDSMRDDIAELINDLKLSTTNIMGHSMGGKVAMLVALHYPQLVEKLVVVDMAPRYYAPHHQPIFDAIQSLGDLSQYKSRKEIETPTFVSLLKNEQTRQFILKNLYRKKTDKGEEFDWRFNLAALEKNIGDRRIELNDVGPFMKPTLFIKGEKSDYIKTEDEPLIKQLFPNVIFKTVAGTGHWVHADKPEEFLKMVMEFLN